MPKFIHITEEGKVIKHDDVDNGPFITFVVQLTRPILLTEFWQTIYETDLPFDAIDGSKDKAFQFDED